MLPTGPPPPAVTPPASGTGWAPTQADSVTSASDCVFTCATGRTKSGTGSSGSCGLNSGYFSASGTANGAGTPCGLAPQDGTWDADQSGVSSTSDCKFTCTVGFEKHGRTCRSPEPGKWADSGVVKDCTAIPHSDWAFNTGAVTSDTGCAFTCKTGFNKNGRSCDLPSGHFIASDGTSKLWCSSEKQYGLGGNPIGCKPKGGLCVRVCRRSCPCWSRLQQKV